MSKKSKALVGVPDLFVNFNPREAQSIFALVAEYIDAFESGDREYAGELLTTLLNKGAVLGATERLMKIMQGAILSGIKPTVDEDTYERICKTHFHVTPATADNYAAVYEAWFSGTFLYNLPEGLNPIDLSFRDLQTGASLIVEGELSEERAEYLFSGDGNWEAKRDYLREEAPAVVKRKKRRTSVVKPKIVITPTGDILFKSQGKNNVSLGHLNITDNDTRIRMLSLRIAGKLKSVLGELTE